MITQFLRRTCRSPFAVLVLVSVTPGLAATPSETLKDPVLEARARVIGQQLRCVVCQNQSIDDSNAPLARDLRVLVRERLAARDTDAQVISFVVSRYGNFVLLRPPMQVDTLALWLGPILLVAIAMIGFGRYLNEQAKSNATSRKGSLTPLEQAQLDKILQEGSSQ